MSGSYAEWKETVGEMTVAEVRASSESLAAGGESSVSILQAWEVRVQLQQDQDTSTVSSDLEALCQATSDSCTLVGSRRRELQSTEKLCTNTCEDIDGNNFAFSPSDLTNNGYCEDGGDGSSGDFYESYGLNCGFGNDCDDCGERSVAVAVLQRPLESGNLAAEIPNLNSTGLVPETTLQSVEWEVSVTQQGGATEASELLENTLAEDQVQSVVSSDLGLSMDDLTVEVADPIFPPMPPRDV